MHNSKKLFEKMCWNKQIRIMTQIVDYEVDKLAVVATETMANFMSEYAN